MPARARQYVPVTPQDTLATVFSKRVALSPDAVAYLEFDAASQSWQPRTWAETAGMVARVRAALAAEPLAPGDRVAIMLRNAKEWVWFDQAAAAQGLVTVPIYVDDRPDNIAWCLGDAGVKLLFVEGEEHLKRLAEVRGSLPGLARIVTVKAVKEPADAAVRALADWLPAEPLAAPP
ncbi:MAG: AMP-binding protein, partial [Burkholderiales bacterium]|nr:AMP-binding protein [Burkholderiales bacterium]